MILCLVEQVVSTISKPLNIGKIFLIERWVIVTLFALNNFITSMFCTAFAPITAVIVSSYVNLDGIWTTILLQVFVIEFFLLGIFVNSLNDKYGLRFAIWACTIPFLVGCWIRMLQGNTGTGFAWLMIGQVVGCFGICFVQSIVSKVSSLWFPDNERALAVSIQ